MNTEREFLRALKGASACPVCQSAVIATDALTFSPEVLKACEANVCGNYGKNWTCPPAVGSSDALRSDILAYKKALVFTTKHTLEDSFDFEGMMEGQKKHDALTEEMRILFGDTNPVYGAGGCRRCEKCAYPKPCVMPYKVYPSIEAAGINVTELSKAAGVKYNNGVNTVTYFSMILFDTDGDRP